MRPELWADYAIFQREDGRWGVRRNGRVEQPSFATEKEADAYIDQQRDDDEDRARHRAQGAE